MSKKIRPIYVVLLISVFIGVVLARMPSLIEFVLTKYIENFSPSKMILIGDNVVCEELKSQIQKQSTTQKEQSYQNIKSLLKLPASEYAAQFQNLSSMRKTLEVLKHDDLPSAIWPGSSYRCLLETLPMFKNHLDEILTDLFHSDLVLSASDSQMRLQVNALIQNNCANEVLCVAPIKNEILRLKTYTRSQVYITYLPMMGEPGYRAIFEIFDQLNDADFKTSNANDVMLAYGLTNSFQMAGETNRAVIQQEIEKRQSDAKYSQLKKDFLKKFQSVAVGSVLPITSVPTIKISDILEKGRDILKQNKLKLPKSLDEIDAWVKSVQSFYGTQTDTEKTQLANILSDLIEWSAKNLGTDADLNQKIINAAWISKVKLPLTATGDLIKDEKTAILGLRLLVMETPINEKNQDLFIQVFSKLNKEDRKKALRLVGEYRSPIGLNSDFLFRVAGLISEEEFGSEFLGVVQSKKDDFVLHWKRIEPTLKDVQAKNKWLFKMFLLTRNEVYATPLKKYWAKSMDCSSSTLYQMSGVLSSDEKMKFIDFIVSCYEQSSQQEDVFKILIYTDLEHWSVLKLAIKNSKKLSSQNKKSLLKRIQTLMDERFAPPVPNEAEVDDGSD